MSGILTDTILLYWLNTVNRRMSSSNKRQSYHKSTKTIFIFLLSILLINNDQQQAVNALYYDGINSYSIYPRLDLQLCSNSSLSFDFTISTSQSNYFNINNSNLNSNNFNLNSITSSASNNLNVNKFGRLLVYAEQQIQTKSIGTSKKLINSYFLIKLVNGNRLVINDFWNINDISFQLPNDYATSWFRFVYTRRLNIVDINLYKFEPTTTPSGSTSAVKLVSVFSKSLTHNNMLIDDSLLTSQSNSDPTQFAFSNLLVGGIGENSYDRNFSYPQIKNIAKFHGYIMNLQYNSLSSQCSEDICSKASSTSSIPSQRQYAIFSSSTSKQYKLQQFVDRDLLMIDDICESDTLTHDICPRDCSCLSNNFVAPYFNCDCSNSSPIIVNVNNNNINNNIKKENTLKCSALFKSFTINFDDENYFGIIQDKFDYPILPSFTKLNVQNVGTYFDKARGVQFKSALSRLNLMPSSEVPDSDACFWNIDECSNGFIQHMIMSIDRIDEKKFNYKVLLFVNGNNDVSSKFIAYIYKNRIFFSIYEYDENFEWLISSPPLDKAKYLNKQLKLTISWLRDKYFSLHIDGLLADMITKPLTPPLNQDIYMNNNLNRNYYEYGIKLVLPNADLTPKNIQQYDKLTTVNHQFTIKYVKRDFYNDLDVQDSKIIVSSPLPSEIIRIDNTQRVMYKIDSPLTGVTTETIELAFRTAQADGVIFYIRNNPIITYFELVRGQPVVVVDTRVKNVYLKPETAALNDNQWHEVKLHRDGQSISVNIDSQYHDSTDLGQSTNNQLLTGGYVYLGLADPNNINLSDKKTFIGEMVRGKVTINNVQQKVVQQPYYWPSMPAISTNQTVNIDTSQISHDGKMINIIINVYGPPGVTVNGVSSGQKNEPDTHFIYLDNLPDTRYISVAPSDKEIDFRTGGSRLESFLIKFQTKQQCGQLVTLINDPRNYIGLEVYDGYLFSSTSANGVPQRYQISRVRVDDGRIYQVNLKQEQQRLLCWLDTDDSYKQPILYGSQPSIAVNSIRVAGQDGINYGYSSNYGFVGCIGAIILNDRDVIDYKFVSSERRQSCQDVIQQPVTLPPPPPTTPAPPSAPVSLGYISFSRTSDILVYNYFYDHEKPVFEDISFIFRTVVSDSVLFTAHNNDESHNPHLIGAYIKQGLVHVVYLNSSYTQDLCFENNVIDDGNLYRLNIRRNSNGHGFIQLQSYVGVTAIDFYTQPGQIKFSKIIVGGADEWSRIRFFGTRLDFIGCIIDLFQVNGNSVIKPADIPKERYNCNVERPRPASTVQPPRPACLPEGYSLSFTSADDAISYQHETMVCEHVNIPFRTRDSRGIIYAHTSNDGSNFILVYLRRGFINLIVRDNNSEKELELDNVRVDDGNLHSLDIHCESAGYLTAYIDNNRQISSNRIELSSSINLSYYTLGYFDSERLSPRYATLDNFRGCLEQVSFNRECLIYEQLADRNRLSCPIRPSPQRLRCYSDSTSECSTDGFCYASLLRNNSGGIERHYRCFDREQLQPADNPVVCQSQDPSRYVVKCCDTEFCNRDLDLRLDEVNNKDDRSVWSFKGSNSGNIQFTPQLQSGKQAEFLFQFNTSRLEGNLFCTRDENIYFRAEIVNQNIMFTINDVKSRRVLKTVTCRAQQGTQYNDNNWHKVQIIKKSRGQVSITCDDSNAQNLNFDQDIPFVNTKYGLSLAKDCVNEKAKKFVGDLTKISYTQDGVTTTFDDLHYSEDPRLLYDSYVEYKPSQVINSFSDQKPISFRSFKSSARLNKWDDSRIGRITFEFRVDIADENGILFSTKSLDNYFAIIVNNGYIESILSPHRVPYSNTSTSSQPYFDRFQRLFPNTKINDGEWHKLEFSSLSDSAGSLTLDDDTSAKLRFPINYWNEESAIVFGYNADLERESLGSFRGCVKGLEINYRVIDWSSTGILENVEASCFNYKFASNQLKKHNGRNNNDLDRSTSSVRLNGNGCIKYNPKNTNSDKESIELNFKTEADQVILFDSVGSEFVIYTQGPSISIRSKDDLNSKTVSEYGVVFNDGNWHKLKIEKADNIIQLEVDSRYKQEFLLPNNKRIKLGPFYLGCTRDKRLSKNKNNLKLKDLKGAIQNVFYLNNGQSKVDLLERLYTGDQTTLIDGIVQWTNQNWNRETNDNDAVTLNENSFLKLDKIDFENTNISFSFKTNENNGLLAFIAPSVSSSQGYQSFSLAASNYLAVELTNGSVSLAIYLDRQFKRISCSSKFAADSFKLNDNKWHRIEIKKDKLSVSNDYSSNPSASITLGCDNYYVRAKISDGRISPIQFNSGNLTRNSQEQLPAGLLLAKEARYLGCLKEFRVDNRPLNLYQSTTVESRQTLQQGCIDSQAKCSRNSRCLNQGDCVDGFGRTTCNCDSTSFIGPRCESAAPILSFNGSHGIDYSTNNLINSQSEDISLRFRTRLRNGLLFSLKKSYEVPSLTVSVEDGRIKCVYDRSKNDKVVYVGEPNVFNNNKWHTVQVKRYGPTVQVKVIDNDKNSYSVLDDLVIDSISYNSIQIGSIKSESLYQEHPNFIGSIQNVKLNGEDLLSYFLNGKTPNWCSGINGYADSGENSLLLHHQMTFTNGCPITLPRISHSDRLNIHLFFKTSQENGILFFRHGRDSKFMSLELKNSKINLLFDLGSGLKELSSDSINKNFNDKSWHEITLKRFDRQRLSLKIDDFKELYVDIGQTNSPFIELETFVLASLSPEYQKIDNRIGNEPFIGCLASLEINNDAPDLYSNRLNLCSGVQYGCVDLTCNPDSCSNNGVCSISYGQVSCNCEMTSYNGPFCKDNSNFYLFGKQNRLCGLIKYPLLPPNVNQESDKLAFGFTTTDPDATLIKIEGDNGHQFIEIELKDGVINLLINLNDQEERFIYAPLSEIKGFNDNTYHVVQLVRNRNEIRFRVDNFEQLKFLLRGDSGFFRTQQFLYVGAIQDRGSNLLNCYYGIISGMFFNGQYILDRGDKYGDVGLVDYKYILIDIDLYQNRSRPLLADQSCPLGYIKHESLCEFSICPLNSDQIADSCSCYQGYYEIEYACVKRNDTPAAPILGSSAKFIPVKAKVAETPIGLILGIISGILLALLAAAIGARKCSDGFCAPAPPPKKDTTSVATKLHTMFASTTNTTNETYELNRREEIPLMQNEQYMRKDEYFKDEYRYPQPVPIFTQSVNETMEMFEQTAPVIGTLSHSINHSSHRDLAMDSLFYSQNNATDYELSNVTCVTMTPNGKYAIIGQSIGTPQIWDTLSGQLIRSMGGACTNSNNLTLTVNGTLLVGLANDGSNDSFTQALQIWEVQTGKPVQMSHQIKCCVFTPSADTNSIFMAGNQRFGRGISVGILDLVTNELTKEIKSDPTISFGENPESIIITPDERHAIVGCRSQTGTNFVVFDITKSTEIAQTKSISLDADPKCIQVLNNCEVLTGTRGGHLIQWNIHTCKPTVSFIDPMDSQAHRNCINQIALSSNKEFLVSASSDGTGKVWNTTTKSLSSILSGHRGEVICASISNNDLVVTGSTDQTVGLWRLNNGNQISTMTVNMNLIEVQMAKHNKTIVAIGEKDGEQQLLMLRVINVQR